MAQSEEPAMGRTPMDSKLAEHIFMLLYQSDDVDTAMDAVLAELGTRYKVSRVYIFEDSCDGIWGRNTFEWCAPGISSQKQKLQHLVYPTRDGATMYRDNFDADGLFVCGDVYTLSANQQAVLCSQDIVSMLQCAMMDGTLFGGFVGFDDCVRMRAWSSEEIATISFVSKIIATFLMKEHRSDSWGFSNELRASLDVSAAYIYIVNLDNFEVLYRNEALRRAFHASSSGGVCYKEFMGRTSPCETCPVRTLKKTGTSQAVEMQRPNGEYILTHASALWDNGRRLAMVSAVDVSAMRRANEQHRIGEEELRVVMQQMGKVVLRYHVPTRTLTMPAAYARQFGLPEVCSNIPSAVLESAAFQEQTDEVKALYARFYQTIENGVPAGMAELPRHGVDGVLRWQRAEFHSIFDDRHNPVSAIVVVEDVTRQHETDKALRLDVERMAAALRTVYPRSISADLTTGRYRIMGYKGGIGSVVEQQGDYDMLYNMAKEYVHPEDRALYCEKMSADALKKLLKSGASDARFESRQRTLHATYHWMETVVVPVKDLYDDHLLAMILFRSIDTQKETEDKLRSALEQVEQANHAKSDFLARMSHDIRTPMNAILGLTALALDEVEHPRLVQQNLEKIRTAGDFLLGLVNDILDMAKIEKGAMTLHPSVYSYSDFLSNMRTIFAPLCQQNGVKFEMEERENILVMTDRVRVNQIFFNLLSNAVKFTPEGGTVRYRTENWRVDKGALTADYIVEDTGIGMSPEFQKHLGEPFLQENNSVTPQLQGTGLGLSIAISLLKLMGGTLAAHSEPGHGTTITVHLSLPLAQPPAAGTAAAALGASATQNISLEGLRILLVEDHPLNAEIARKLLEKQGAVIYPAVNGKEGMEKFAASACGFFDAVLMDIRMPVMDGLASARAIRALHRPDADKVPIIAMTANAYDEDVEESISAGMNAHLTKPIDSPQMYSTLHRLCGVYKAMRAKADPCAAATAVKIP